MTLDLPAMRTMLNLLKPRYLASAACCLMLAACGGGGNNDSIRIGSGQTPNSGTTGSADFPIFYIKRTTPDLAVTATKNLDDVRRVRLFNTNADLFMRDRAATSATERNISARVHPANELWDVKDLDVSPDGGKVIFAMRGPLKDNQKDKDPPNWGIWEYTIASDDLHRVVVQDDLSGLGGHYVSPHYLPDGHIIFTSTRQVQSKAVLLDEGKGQFEAQDEDRKEPAFDLHVMDATGGNIHQVSFNQSHDMDATVLADGRVLFSRWDHAPGRNGVHFYAANPDGTNTELVYGSASHATFPDTDVNGAITFPTVQFTKPREMPDGRILTLVRPFTDTEYGGDLYIIDTKTYVENSQAAVAGSGAAGPAASKATPGNVRLINAPSPGGRFVSAAPLWDGTNRMLAAWTQCRLVDPATSAIVNCTSTRLADPTFVAAPPVYGLWMFNPTDGTQQPVVPPVDGVMISDVAIAQPRTAPTFRPVSLASNTTLDQNLRTKEGVGILDIRSVYDFDGTVAATATGCNITTTADPTNATCYGNRPARFLRIEKAVSLPSKDVRDIDNSAFGATPFMREILGYIPIEPDGSVRVKVPGNVAFQISIVDTDGRRVPTFPLHNAWLSIQPGETVQCTGCHTRSATVPPGQNGISHGRSGVFASAYLGAGAINSVFPGANSAFKAVSSGDTMAQARAAWSCANEQCASVSPSVNVAFANVWPNTTLPAESKVIPTTPPRSGDFALVYAGIGGLTTKVPTTSTCLTVWSNTCRITINYLEHIQPLWDAPRITTTTDPITMITTVVSDHTCTTCHNRKNAAGAAQIPAGQLELVSDPSDDPNAGVRVTSYQELLFTDNALVLNNGVLSDNCLVFAVDPVTGLPTTQCQTFETVTPSISARNARGSRFFSKFATGGSHVSWLTPGELRLISEWVDIGAQYYNDPFKAPVN